VSVNGRPGREALPPGGKARSAEGAPVSAVIEVVSAGVHTTVQDAGRIGYQAVGLPASGPLDRISFELANALVGNARGTPALEILLQGPTLAVCADSVRIAVVGGGADLELCAHPPRRIPGGRSARLVRGDVFRIPGLPDALCAYLAIEGGFAIAPVLGSASTYVRSGIGGLDGRPLRQGDRLPLAQGGVAERTEQALAHPLDLALGQPIRVVLGPQDDYFTAGAMTTFLGAEYRVSHQADRMGFRLDGPQLAHAKGYNIVSDGTAPGAIQVPGSGQPIILMVDHQTTGGYPKIATVISADLPVVGRRKPGSALSFVAVDVPEALRLRREQEAALARDIAELQPVPGEDAIDVARLHSENLISGVTLGLD
jgi:biotin-dependent carboxylase-like uncharacterized protein